MEKLSRRMRAKAPPRPISVNSGAAGLDHGVNPRLSKHRTDSLGDTFPLPRGLHFSASLSAVGLMTMRGFALPNEGCPSAW
jgi:hypothetical protein